MNGEVTSYGNTSTQNAWDTHTSGRKCYTIVVDTDAREIRVYNNGHFMIAYPNSIVDDFANGLGNTNTSPLYIEILGATFDEPPGGKVYLESLRVFDRVLSGDELFNSVVAVLAYDFSNGSVDDTVIGGTDSQLKSTISGRGLGFVTHPVKPDQLALYVDRDVADDSNFTSDFKIPNTCTRVPSRNFSIQIRFYFVADGVGDDFDMMFTLRYHIGSNSHFDFYFNGQDNVLFRKVQIDQQVLVSANLTWQSDWDLHTTGHKCLTYVIDTTQAELRVYNNGILIEAITGVDDFTPGVVDSTQHPIIITNSVVSNDEPPGGKVYIESLKVFDGVLTGTELL